MLKAALLTADPFLVVIVRVYNKDGTSIVDDEAKPTLWVTETFKTTIKPPSAEPLYTILKAFRQRC